MLTLFTSIIAVAKYLARSPRREGIYGERLLSVKLLLQELDGRNVPANFYVTNLTDSGLGSLRQAILDANDPSSLNEPHDIYFLDYAQGQANVITIQSQLPTLLKDISIHGPTDAQIVIERQIDSVDSYRIFSIFAARTCTFENLEIRYGVADNGGGIENYGTLTLNNCHIHDCAATANGGAIYSRLYVELNNCMIRENYAALNGGGIYSTGNPSSHFVVVEEGWIFRNAAEFNGGGIYSSGGLAVVSTYNVNMINNFAHEGSGGAIYHTSGQISVVADTDPFIADITGNYSKYHGGAIYTAGNTQSTIDAWLHSNFTSDSTIYVNGVYVGSPYQIYINFDKVLDDVLFA
jgi:predicted outer membrane repeat protein